MEGHRMILFFDGTCSFCNASVQFILKRDSKQCFYFAPLEGTTAELYLKDMFEDELDSIVLYEDGILYTESTAALRVATRLKGLWKVFGIGLLIPRLIRDPIYRIIAKRRQKIMNQRTCRMFTSAERKRILD